MRNLLKMSAIVLRNGSKVSDLKLSLKGTVVYLHVAYLLPFVYNVGAYLPNTYDSIKRTI